MCFLIACNLFKIVCTTAASFYRYFFFTAVSIKTLTMIRLNTGQNALSYRLLIPSLLSLPFSSSQVRLP